MNVQDKMKALSFNLYKNGNIAGALALALLASELEGSVK
jgi:hypothetical protein